MGANIGGERTRRIVSSPGIFPMLGAPESGRSLRSGLESARPANTKLPPAEPAAPGPVGRRSAQGSRSTWLTKPECGRKWLSSLRASAHRPPWQTQCRREPSAMIGLPRRGEISDPAGCQSSNVLTSKRAELEPANFARARSTRAAPGSTPVTSRPAATSPVVACPDPHPTSKTRSPCRSRDKVTRSANKLVGYPLR